MVLIILEDFQKIEIFVDRSLVENMLFSFFSATFTFWHIFRPKWVNIYILVVLRSSGMSFIILEDFLETR